MEPNAAICDLRQLLAERFPVAVTRQGLFFPTGIPLLDAALDGGLWKGGLTEISGTGPSAGCQSVLAGVLEASAEARRPVALIDGADEFDPQPMGPETLAWLLWVRCGQMTHFFKAADLILRDGNLPVVLLNLRGCPRESVRRIPNTTWYRLQRIVEQSAVACLIATPYFMVSSAQFRVELRGTFGVADLDRDRTELFARMKFQLTRRHGLTGGGNLAAAV